MRDRQKILTRLHVGQTAVTVTSYQSLTEVVIDWRDNPQTRSIYSCGALGAAKAVRHILRESGLI
jgi:hypothetical protein